MKKKFMYLKLYCIKSLIQRFGQKADTIISGTLTTTHHRKLFNADKMEVPNQINPLLTLNLVASRYYICQYDLFIFLLTTIKFIEDMIYCSNLPFSTICIVDVAQFFNMLPCLKLKKGSN